MKTALAFGAVLLAATFVFSLASAFAEDNVPAGSHATGTASLATRALDHGRAPASAQPQPAGTGAAPAAGEGSIAIEKLIIGLGIAGVIVLAAFRWGTGAHQKKESKEHTVSGSPSA